MLKLSSRRQCSSARLGSFFSSIGRSSPSSFFFFLNDPAPTEISPLPLPDPLPIFPAPKAHAEVVSLAERLPAAQPARRTIWLERRKGAEIALKGMLMGAGFAVSLDAVAPDGAERILASEAGLLGLPLALFKALQLLRSKHFQNVFRDFTAVDL